MCIRDGDGRSVEEKGKSKCTEVRAHLGGGVCVGVGVGVGVCVCVCVCSHSLHWLEFD